MIRNGGISKHEKTFAGPGATLSAMIGSAGAQSPLPPTMTYNWTGCHAGINAGWIHDSNKFTFSPSGAYLTPPGAAAPPNAAGTGDFAVDVAALNDSIVT
jgi:hypothetical protein